MPQKVQRAIDLCENIANAESVAELAYESVRDGEVFTDADVKVDELYRALADADVLITKDDLKQHCTVCWASSGLFGGAHTSNCLYAEAVEYVNNNPKAAADER